MSINLRWRQFASWRRKNGLFCTIVSWIIIAIIAYTLLSAIWGYGHGWNRILAGWHIGATHDPLERIKVTLTALGGVGAERQVHARVGAAGQGEAERVGTVFGHPVHGIDAIAQRLAHLPAMFVAHQAVEE